MFDRGRKIIARSGQYGNTMPHARLTLALTLVFAVAMVGVLRTVQAADGDLDTTFSSDGKVTTDFVGDGEQGRAIAIQDDGKSVVAGHDANPAVGRDFAVARYNINGSLDNTFSTNGRVTIDFSFDDVAEAIAIQEDGKIVVAGFASPDGRAFALARLNTDGSLDDGTAGDSTPGDEFGDDGKVVTFFTAHDTIYDLAIQEDGKIIAAGTVGFPNSSPRRVGATAAIGADFAIARYNTDGSLDDGTAGDSTPGDEFGSKGLARTSFTPNSDDEAYGVVIQEDGRIVAAGTSIDLPPPSATSAAPGNDFALARYNTDGSLDDGTAGDSTPGDEFGSNGLVTTDFFAGDDQAQDVRLQSDGKIVAGGFAFNSSGVPGPSYDFALARYNTDGSLDDDTPGDTTPGDSFGGDGKVTTDFASTEDQGYGLAIQSDEKIILAGTASVPGGSGDNDFALARYNTDGSLDDGTPSDTTPGGAFGGDGLVTTDFFDGDDQVRDVALQTNGRIVAAGFAFHPATNYQFAAARYLNDLSISDLSVEVTDAPDPVIASLNVTYTIRVKNNGSANATNVVLVNRLPSSSIFISAIPSQGTCTNNDEPPITCDLGNLAVGVTAIVRIKIQTLNIHNTIFNTSTVSADQTDPNLANNEEVEKTTVLRARKLSFSPPIVTGGCQNSVGTLLLTSPAPPLGLRFQLSDNSAAVKIPSTLVVPGGQLSATFPVTTHNVSSTTIVTVTARDGDNIITGRIKLIPVTISSLTITPNTVHGGDNATGKVTLVCAPEQDVVVRLLNDRGAAKPAQSEIVIPAGQTMGQFTINTLPVSEQHDVTFTAVTKGISKQAVLHVIP